MIVGALPLVVLMAARIAIVASAERADGQPVLRLQTPDGPGDLLQDVFDG